MTTVTENDLKEIKDLINSRFDNVENRLSNVENRFDNVESRLSNVEDHLARLENGQNTLEKNQIEIKTRLEEWKPAISKMYDFSEKIGELKNLRQFIVIIITGLASGVIGWFIRNSQP
jgi:chaperonin cofactor prefoldin